MKKLRFRAVLELGEASEAFALGVKLKKTLPQKTSNQDF